MNNKRRGDLAPPILRLSWPGTGTGTAPVSAPAVLGAAGADGADGPSPVIPNLFLLEFEGQDALLVAGGSAVRMERGEGGEELMSRVRARMASPVSGGIRQSEDVCAGLAAYAERLRVADTLRELHDAVTRCAAEVVGGCSALLLRRDGDQLRVVDPRGPATAVYGTFPILPEMAGHGVLTAAGVTSPESGAEREFAPLLATYGAHCMAYARYGEDGLLCLFERRRDRGFAEADWMLLHALVGHAELATERIRLLEQIRQLQLRDAITGLATRRHLEVAAGRLEAAARRGHGLAVVLLRVEWSGEAPAAPDGPSWDEALRALAECLQDAARGSDLVVRYGEDEFLVLLSATHPNGATVFVRRVRERADRALRLAVGVAEFGPASDSVERLIRAAADKLDATQAVLRLAAVTA